MDFIGHGWGMGFGMWVIFLLFIFIVFYIVKESKNSQGQHSSAQDILDRRYANGEIDTKEYEERSKAINKTK